MAHKVKCIYCQQVFDRDKYPYIQVSSRRYAHPACAQAENKKKQEEIIRGQKEFINAESAKDLVKLTNSMELKRSI